MRVMRVLSTRWLTRGRGWAVSTAARANISRNEVPRNLDKAYPFFDYTSHIGCFRGLLKRIGPVRQNFAASKRQGVAQLRGIPASSAVSGRIWAIGNPLADARGSDSRGLHIQSPE